MALDPGLGLPPNRMKMKGERRANLRPITFIGFFIPIVALNDFIPNSRAFQALQK